MEAAFAAEQQNTGKESAKTTQCGEEERLQVAKGVGEKEEGGVCASKRGCNIDINEAKWGVREGERRQVAGGSRE